MASLEQIDVDEKAPITVHNVLLREQSGNWEVDGIHVRNAAHIFHPLSLVKMKAMIFWSIKYESINQLMN